MMKAHVWVMLKSTVLDPQGQTIERALASLGYEKVQNVRQGKFFVLDLDGLSRADAQSQVERIAKDVGVSASELRTLATFGPEAADLLLRRMTARDLDRNEIARTEPQTFQDMQRVCIMCDHHRRCARDFARDSASDAWNEYCPNAATLIALNALPWTTRHE